MLFDDPAFQPTGLAKGGVGKESSTTEEEMEPPADEREMRLGELESPFLPFRVPLSRFKPALLTSLLLMYRITSLLMGVPCTDYVCLSFSAAVTCCSQGEIPRSD